MSESVLVATKLKSGAILRVEARALQQPPGTADAEVAVAGSARSTTGDPERLVSGGLPDLSEALQTVEDLSTEIATLFRRVAPDHCSVEFEVELAAEPGKVVAMLVRGSGKASFKVTLSWNGPAKAAATG